MTDRKLPIHRLQRADKFIRGRKLSSGKVAFLLSEFLAWQKEQPRRDPPKDDDGCRHE